MLTDRRAPDAQSLMVRSFRNGGYLVSQIASSVTNAVVVLGIATTSSQAVFGQFAAAFIVYSIALALTGASFGALCGLREDLRASLPEAGRALLGGLWLFVLPVSVLGAGAGLLLRDTFGYSLTIVFAGLPVLMTHEVLRWFGFGSDRPWLAVALDVGWLVGVAPFALVLDLDGLAIFLAWIVAAGVAVAFSLMSTRTWPSLRNGWILVRKERSRLLSLSADAGVGTVSVNVVTMGVGSIVGFAGLGALRGAQTLAGPLAAVARAVAIATLGRSARIADAGLKHIYSGGNRVRWSGVMASSLAAAGSLLVPERLGQLVLGDSWDGARPLLPYLLIGVAATFFGIASLNVLRCAPGGLVRIVVVRSRTAAASVAFVPGAAYLFGVAGAAAALASLSWIATLWLDHEARRRLIPSAA